MDSLWHLQVQNGMCHVVDHHNDFITIELESLLSNLPEVMDCAVIGVYSNSQATELPLAFVVVRPGVDANKALEDKIKDYVASQVAGYKRLRGGVRFIDQIPKSPSGKILRRLLRDIINRENMTSKL